MTSAMRGGLVREMAARGKSPRTDAFPAPEAPTIAGSMASENAPDAASVYERRFPPVTDALTRYVWRAPAVRLARWAEAAELPAATFTMIQALLSLLVFALLWNGRYALGLVASVAVMILSVAALLAERSAASTATERRLRQAVEIVFPPLWWWAWAHGLEAYGRPL